MPAITVTNEDANEKKKVRLMKQRREYTVEPRLSGLFLWYKFGYEYLLVTIKIRSHILFKTTALKGAVKCKGFWLSKSRGSARACRKVGLLKPGFHMVVSVVSVVSVVRKKFIGQIEFILPRTTSCICRFFCIEQLYGRFP